LRAALDAPDTLMALAAAVDRWVAGLSIGAARHHHLPVRKAEHTLEAGSTATMKPDERMTARHGVVWISGSGSGFCFRDTCAVALDAAGAAFPVAHEAWLNATQAVKLVASSAVDALNDGTGWRGLAAFHAALLECLAEGLDAAEDVDRDRMRRRTETDAGIFKAALVKVANVMTPMAAGDFTPDASIEDDIAAAFAVVAGYLGATLRQPKEFVGAANEKDKLFQVARATGLRLRYVTLEEGWWRRSGQPMICFEAESGIPVAVVPKGTSRFALRRRGDLDSRITGRAEAKTLSTEAYVVYGSLPAQPLKFMDLARFAARFVKHDAVRFMTFLGLSTLLGLMVPIVTGILVGSAIPFAEVPTIILLAAALGAVALGQLAFDVTRSVALLRFETQVETHLQAGLWDRVLRLPARFFRDHMVGDLVRRMMGLTMIRQTVSNTVVQAVFGVVFSLANLGLMYVYNPTLAMAGGLLLLGFLIVVGFGNWLQFGIQKRIMDLDGQVNGLVTQLLVGIAKLRIANAEQRAFGEWASRYAEQRRQTFKARAIGTAMTVFYTSFTAISSLVFFYLVAFVLDTPISPADFVAFSAAYGQFMAAMTTMAGAVTGSMAALALYERMGPILEAEPEIDVSDEHPGSLGGDIEVSHVSFSYGPELPDVLSDVSIKVEPGQFVAIVGGSGSGKSTLLRLILGFETPRSGAVFYDGKDLSKLDLAVLRRQLGVVLQNGGLMPGSIFENIVGSTSLTLDDAWEAARNAGLAADVEAMPMGMHTIVSEGGGTLSGGQRQRLMIARALVNKPPVLLFDEATSALDNITQATVTESLEKLNLSRIVIAHRLSTIEKADRIYVMDRGRIVEQGRFTELMAADGAFSELAVRQIV
jgi:ATP-binding cassette subfamily C protein